MGDRNLRDFIELMARWAEDAGMIDAGVHAAVGRGGDAAVGEAPDADAGLVGIQPVKRRGRGLGIMRSSGGGGPRRKVRPQPAGKRPRPAGADDRPAVERPKKRDSDLDDFLL